MGDDYDEHDMRSPVYHDAYADSFDRDLGEGMLGGEGFGRERRSLWHRSFSQMHPGSQRGGTIALVVSALGAGILSLPSVMKNTGLVMGLVLMVLGALLAVLTLELLVSCALNTGITSYSGLTLKVFGFRVAKACEAAMIIYCFGSCVGYLIIIGSCLDALLAGSLGEDLPPIFTKNFNLCLITGVIVLPLACLKDLSKLRYASLVSVAAMLYLSTSVVIRAVAVGPDLGPALASLNDIAYVRFDRGFPKSVCLVFFAYASHVNLLSVHAQVTNPSMRRMTKVTRRSVSLELILYCAFGAFGYLSFHAVTCGNLLQNYEKDDLLFIIARIAVVCSLSVVCPLIFSPAHADIDRLFFSNRPFSWPRHILVSVLLVGGALLLAIFIPEVSVVFGLLGATMSVLFCFVLPIMLFIYTSPLITRFNVYTLLTLLALLTLAGVAGVADIVWDLSIPSDANSTSPCS